MHHNNKERYRKFCQDNPDIPLFLSFDWINAMASDKQWNVAVVNEGEDVLAVLPYFIRKKMGFTSIGQPPLTPYLGPWVKYPEGQKYAKRLSYEKKIYQQLIEQLPRFHQLHLKFPHEIKNGLPFHWNGFRLNTHYTYTLTNLDDENKLLDEMRGNIRRQIKKGEKKLEVQEVSDIDLIYRVKELGYSEKDEEIPYSLDDLKRADRLCKQKKCRKMWMAIDNSNNIHSVLYLVWDKHSSYYLVGSSDPNYKNTGGMSLLMWEAIKFSAKVTGAFNFEGSMIEPVERFFRGFGARQTPCLYIAKTNSLLLRIKQVVS